MVHDIRELLNFRQTGRSRVGSAVNFGLLHLRLVRGHELGQRG